MLTARCDTCLHVRIMLVMFRLQKVAVMVDSYEVAVKIRVSPSIFVVCYAAFTTLFLYMYVCEQRELRVKDI